MQISKFSEYSFRTLMYLYKKEENLVIVEELAKDLAISKDHLKKVVNRLANYGYIKSTKGRHGGLKLGMDPSLINMGELFKRTEDNLMIIECLEQETICSFMSDQCRMKGVFSDALTSFINELAQYTLEDIMNR